MRIHAIPESGKSNIFKGGYIAQSNCTQYFKQWCLSNKGNILILITIRMELIHSVSIAPFLDDLNAYKPKAYCTVQCMNTIAETGSAHCQSTSPPKQHSLP